MASSPKTIKLNVEANILGTVIEPGDRLVVAFRRRLTDKDANDVLQIIQEQLPGVTGVILDDVSAIAVYHDDKTNIHHPDNPYHHLLEHNLANRDWSAEHTDEGTGEEMHGIEHPADGTLSVTVSNENPHYSDSLLDVRSDILWTSCGWREGGRKRCTCSPCLSMGTCQRGLCAMRPCTVQPWPFRCSPTWTTALSY